MEKANQYFVNFTLLLMPVLMVLYKSAASTYVAVCLLWSLIVVWKLPSKSEFHKWEKLVVYTVLAYVALALLNLWWNGYNHMGAKQVGYIFRLVAVLPILAILHRAKPDMHMLMIGCVGAALASFGFAVYEIKFLGRLRASGATDIILFGCFSILFAFFSGALSIYAVKLRKVISILFYFMGFVGGLAATWVSSTRGALIALPGIVLIYLWHTTVFLGVQRRTNTIVLILLFTGAIAGVLVVSDSLYSVNARFHKALKQFETYQPGQGTSVGRRLDAWHEAYVAFSENPVFGVGHGNQYDFVKEKAEAGVPRMGRANLFDSHSDYFFILSRKGVLGLLIHFALLLVPLGVFFRVVKKPDADLQRTAAICGVITIFSFAVFGLTFTLFVRSQAICIFAYFLALFMFFSTNKHLPDTHEKTSS